MFNQLKLPCHYQLSPNIIKYKICDALLNTLQIINYNVLLYIYKEMQTENMSLIGQFQSQLESNEQFTRQLDGYGTNDCHIKPLNTPQSFLLNSFYLPPIFYDSPFQETSPKSKQSQSTILDSSAEPSIAYEINRQNEIDIQLDSFSFRQSIPQHHQTNADEYQIFQSDINIQNPAPLKGSLIYFDNQGLENNIMTENFKYNDGSSNPLKQIANQSSIFTQERPSSDQSEYQYKPSKHKFQSQKKVRKNKLQTYCPILINSLTQIVLPQCRKKCQGGCQYKENHKDLRQQINKLKTPSQQLLRKMYKNPQLVSAFAQIYYNKAKFITKLQLSKVKSISDKRLLIKLLDKFIMDFIRCVNENVLV